MQIIDFVKRTNIPSNLT